MQWFLLLWWSGVILYGTHKRARWLRPLMAAGLAGAMGTQLWLLHVDGLLRWQDALPLHLCSLFGCLCIPILWRAPELLFEGCCFLGAPGAFLTLFFPAVVRCSHPVWMQGAFYQLHVLVALMPLYWHAQQKPLPTDPRITLVAGSGYLAFICAFNRFFNANYLFLRSAPYGTPLQILFQHGPAFYLCALVMLAMLVFSGAAAVYAQSRK